SENNHVLAIVIAKIPEQIRGFDLVKQQHVESAKSENQELLKQFRNSAGNTAGLNSVETTG
ncbi:MAG: hypothetical protein NZ867_01550, partial [SAR324 cluster bacterium]|nr:hypothetical protein [SAR324 cluster bacterium]